MFHQFHKGFGGEFLRGQNCFDKLINAVHPSIEAEIFSRDNESGIVVVNDDPMNKTTELCCSNEHDISDCRRDILIAVALAPYSHAVEFISI